MKFFKNSKKFFEILMETFVNLMEFVIPIEFHFLIMILIEFSPSILLFSTLFQEFFEISIEFSENFQKIFRMKLYFLFHWLLFTSFLSILFIFFHFHSGKVRFPRIFEQRSCDPRDIWLRRLVYYWRCRGSWRGWGVPTAW